MSDLLSVRSKAFQSTLSLRRATVCVVFFEILHGDFNPRSPCGERLSALHPLHGYPPISIHALLAESDDPPAH